MGCLRTLPARGQAVPHHGDSRMITPRPSGIRQCRTVSQEQEPCNIMKSAITYSPHLVMNFVSLGGSMTAARNRATSSSGRGCGGGSQFYGGIDDENESTSALGDGDSARGRCDGIVRFGSIRLGGASARHRRQSGAHWSFTAHGDDTEQLPSVRRQRRVGAQLRQRECS